MAFAGFMVLFTAVCFATIMAPWWMPLVPAYWPGTVSPAVRLALEMLRTPRGWSIDAHYAIHATGARIWIGNGMASTGFSTHGDVRPHGSGGGNVPLTARERRLLYLAAKRCERLNREDQLSADLTAWSERVSRYAERVGG